MIPVRYNIRYLGRRWTSTLMTALTFGLVVAVFIIVMSLARGIENSLTTTGDPLNLLIMRQGVQAEGQSQVQIERYYLVRSLPGIAQDAEGQPLAAPEVLVLVNRPKAHDHKPTNLLIRGFHPLALSMRPEVRVVEGRLPRPGLREAMVSRRVSQRFAGMKLGDTPQLGRGRWTIVGLFDAAGTAFDSEMWTDYRDLMQEFDRGDYNTVLVRASDAAAVKQITRAVDEDPRIKLEAKTEQRYYEDQTNVAGPLKAFGGFLAVIMSIGACFAGMNTMYASVANRVREIGTLRVLGFQPHSILLSFLFESALLALAGGVVGCLLALPINGLATGTTNFETFSEIVFYFTITPDLMLKGLLFALIIGIVGGLPPAWSASRQPLLNALRHV